MAGLDRGQSVGHSRRRTVSGEHLSPPAMKLGGRK
jgi:hypothetical protein